VSLSSIVANALARRPETVKVSTLVAILDLNGPSSVVIRKGRSIGTTITLFELIVGDESDTTATVTVWSELAERWGNLTEDAGVKKGDIVVLESMSCPLQSICALMPLDITAHCTRDETVAFSASTAAKSSCVICYRTFLDSEDDRRMQPDLRLGESDTAVRKVEAVVNWYQYQRGSV
jgi:hypothetical protein